MLPSMMSRTALVRKRFPRVLDHGTMVVDTTATPATETVYGSLQPGTGETDQVNRDGAETAYMFFAKLADVRHFDIFALSDGDYYVNGDPERWETGILDHMVVRLSRWSG